MPDQPSNAPRGVPDESVPLFHRLGPRPFARLAEELYRNIDRDTRIRRHFPEDLSATSEAVRDMREFLTQFFGGPSDYSARKGHPRLRARHMRFPIDQAARDAWLDNALHALETMVASEKLDEPARQEIGAYLVRTSQFMINRE
ncbi:MAG: Group 2 hemoglobin GlbO [Planctomycetota bacterium]